MDFQPRWMSVIDSSSDIFNSCRRAHFVLHCLAGNRVAEIVQMCPARVSVAKLSLPGHGSAISV